MRESNTATLPSIITEISKRNKTENWWILPLSMLLLILLLLLLPLGVISVNFHNNGQREEGPRGSNNITNVCTVMRLDYTIIVVFECDTMTDSNQRTVFSSIIGGGNDGLLFSIVRISFHIWSGNIQLKRWIYSFIHTFTHTFTGLLHQ